VAVSINRTIKTILMRSIGAMANMPTRKNSSIPAVVIRIKTANQTIAKYKGRIPLTTIPVVLHIKIE
jgi:hypothetical protein